MRIMDLPHRAESGLDWQEVYVEVLEADLDAEAVLIPKTQVRDGSTVYNSVDYWAKKDGAVISVFDVGEDWAITLRSSGPSR